MQRLPRSLITWLADRSTVGIVAAWIVSLAGFGGRFHWLADALNHPRWHVAWLCGLAAVWCGWTGKRRWMYGAIGCALVNIAVVQPWTWYLPGSASNGSFESTQLKVLFWNINAGLTDTASVIDTIHRHDPDVVAILELHPTQQAGLEPLRQSHPHLVERARVHSFGMGVYSRLPTTWSKSGGEPVEIRGRLVHGDATVEIWALHVLPPLGTDHLRERNEQLVRVAGDVADAPIDVPILLGGDFNITPWCREYDDFVAASGLMDSRRGHGYQSTWPAKLGWLGIPIDHVLVSPSCRILERQVVRGGSVSDHAGVLVTIALPPAN